jgi:hypothetical protein
MAVHLGFPPQAERVRVGLKSFKESADPMKLALPFAIWATFGVAAPVWAQEGEGLNVDLTATGAPGGVARYDMAQALYALGVANKDAVLALAAAKLAASVQMTDLDRSSQQTRAKGIADAADAASAPPDVGMMFAAARAYAAEDESLLGLIDGVVAEEVSGLGIGATRQRGTLTAGAVEDWKIPFFGASYAEIGVIGDGDSPLVVTVADENGNLITCPARVGDRFYCDFVPRWNGFFTTSIKNTGQLKNSYYLLTN